MGVGDLLLLQRGMGTDQLTDQNLSQIELQFVVCEPRPCHPMTSYDYHAGSYSSLEGSWARHAGTQGTL